MADTRQTISIASQSGLNDLADHLHRCKRFAFDTEFVSEDTYQPDLGLIQVATSERLVIIDPIAVPDLSPFWEAVTNPDLEVVMHAAGEDLRICHLQTGRLPTRVVDVQVAAGLVGFGYPGSLTSLLAQVLRVTVSGGETRTDWRKRPLSSGQLRYALDDVRYLLELADTIEERLDQLGRRAWAEEEYVELLNTIAARDDAERWRRLPGLGPLNRRSLEMARLLWDWRRLEARRVNRPVRQVMRDDILIAIARKQPTSRTDLEALRDFNRPNLLAHSKAILSLIDQAREVPPDQLPDATERPDDAPGVAMVVNVLTAVLNRGCAQGKVSAGLVGSASDLREMVRWYLGGSSVDQLPSLMQGWRWDVCGKLLLDVLSGNRSLRIVDPASDIPVELDRVAFDSRSNDSA